MDTLKHFYKTAQVCENGHLRNKDIEYHGTSCSFGPDEFAEVVKQTATY